jgi:hypothetical protein
MDRRRLCLSGAALLATALPLVARAGEHADKKELPPYLELKPVTLTVVRPNRRHGAMTVELGLNIPDPKLRAQAQLMQPVLRDAYVRALQPWAIRMDPGSSPNMGFLTMSLQRETNRVLGRPGARVLLGGVMVM